MPTIPRRWPTEVENERTEALGAASEATLILQKAQEKLDLARARMSTNQSLAIVLLVDADRHTADASTRVERIMRYMAMARGKPISGRWPQGVTRQREEIEDALRSAVDLLDRVQVAMPQARAKVNHNPSLSEAILADIGQYLARSLTQTERVVRLLVEAGIGRD